MYNLQGYAGMIGDRRRVEAYRRALEQVVRPDSVVMDIGTGLGIFSFLACQAGARKVYAIEPCEVIAVARELAKVNGYVERIEFIEDVSTRVTLADRVDTIVSDLGGATPLYGQHLPSIADARKRLLKPGGALIPKCDTLWAGVVNAATFHTKIAPSTDKALGLDMQFAWNMAANLLCNKSFSELLTAPERLVTLEYSEIEDPNFHKQVTCDVTHAGLGHGINIWFERTLIDGVYFSSGPGEPEMVYGRLFLPWPNPVKLDLGDTVILDLRADFRISDYIWSWHTAVFSKDGEKCRFRQCSFLGEPRSPARMRKKRATHVPRLNEEGESDRLILLLMNGRNAIKDIARELQQRFPARFETLEHAIGYVADFSAIYSF